MIVDVGMKTAYSLENDPLLLKITLSLLILPYYLVSNTVDNYLF